jgi:hypothetical protein
MKQIQKCFRVSLPESIQELAVLPIARLRIDHGRLIKPEDRFVSWLHRA